MKSHQINYQAGMVAPLFAISMFTLLIFAALAIDGGMALVNQRRIHIAADAASLAAVTLFSPTVLDNDIFSEARRVAALNGVSNAEISSIQCGKWSTISGVSSFQACCGSLQTCPCVNCRDAGADSVRVTTRRSVPTTFARVMNLNSLSPSGVAVAKAVRSPGTCVRPVGVEPAILSGVAIGGTFVVGKSAPGNWGKLDLGGVNMSSGTNFYDAMMSPTCSQSAAPGDVVSAGTGFGGSIGNVMDDVVNANLNTGMYIAVNTPFVPGNGNVTISEVIKVDYVGDNGKSGTNWQGTFRVVARNVNAVSSGTTTSRALVK